MTTAHNIDAAILFADMPEAEPLTLVPFFTASLPLIPPGVNASYMPAMQNGHMTIVHTPAAEDFLLKALWEFRDYRNARITNRSIFDAISATSAKIPLQMKVTVFYKTLWQHDNTGPLKIIEDATFAHLAFMAPPLCKSWNDNRVCDTHLYKRVDRLRPRFEIEIACALIAEK